MNQDPKSNKEIKEFVGKMGVTFPMFSKIDVNGSNEHPVYTFLKKCFPGDITWNFSSKFLISRDGIPFRRFEKESTKETEEFIAQTLTETKEGEGQKTPVEEKEKTKL